MKNKPRTSTTVLDNGHATLESMSQALWYNRWSFELFRPFVHGDILEVGCGIGNFTSMLLDQGSVHAIDIEPSYVRITKKKMKDKATVGLGDIEKGKYFVKLKQFDTIICLNVLEHIDDHVQALKNMHKLLKPRGCMVLLVPAHRFLYGSIDEAIGHYRRYNKNELSDLLHQLQFEILLSQTINFFGAAGWFVSGRLLKTTTVDERKLKLFDSLARFILPIEERLRVPIGTSIVAIAQKR